MTVAVNKCRITKDVLDKLNELYWGFTCKRVDEAIYENYMAYLNCSTIFPNICYIDSCNNPIVDFICNMTIASIGYDIQEDEVTAIFNIAELTGYEEPLEYLWEFDESVFIATSALNQSTLTLRLRPGKSFDYIVTPITLTITDVNNCKVEQTCYLTPEGMECADDYVPCGNGSNLIITDTFVNCASASGLVVTNI